MSRVIDPPLNLSAEHMVKVPSNKRSVIVHRYPSFAHAWQAGRRRGVPGQPRFRQCGHGPGFVAVSGGVPGERVTPLPALAGRLFPATGTHYGPQVLRGCYGHVTFVLRLLGFGSEHPFGDGIRRVRMVAVTGIHRYIL